MNRWYSVKGAKPPVGTRVLVANTAWVGVAIRHKERTLGSHWACDEGAVILGVTHWMWLPSVPVKKHRPTSTRSDHG